MKKKLLLVFPLLLVLPLAVKAAPNVSTLEATASGNIISL